MEKKHNKKTVARDKDKISISKKELEELTSKASERDDFYDKLLRKQAEVENTKKRLNKEKSEFFQYASEGLISEILPVIDNLDRAISHMNDTTEVSSLKEGIVMIHRQLHQVLEVAGLTKIESVGQKFDPHMHEAIMAVESEEQPDDVVVEEIQCGYKLKDRLLRPAIVKVSKKKNSET